MGFSFLVTGSALPKRVVTNNELSEFLDTSDEWISTRTGIKERRVLTDETLTSLAIEAAKKALENASIKAEQLDYIFCSTVLGDKLTPQMSCLIQRGVGASCPAFDINGACSGFMYALDIADSYFESNKAKNVLIVSAEAMTRLADWTDRATCVLFGDGAGAVVLGKGENVLGLKMTAQGGDELMNIPSIKGNSPYNKLEKKPSYLYMAGQEVYKFATSAIHDSISALLNKLSLTTESLDHVVLHQANLRIIETARKKLKMPLEKFSSIIQRTGNLSSASIPVLLDKMNRDGKLKEGQIIAMSAFGGGLTTGTAIIRWGR